MVVDETVGLLSLNEGEYEQFMELLANSVHRVLLDVCPPESLCVDRLNQSSSAATTSSIA